MIVNKSKRINESLRSEIVTDTGVYYKNKSDQFWTYIPNSGKQGYTLSDKELEQELKKKKVIKESAESTIYYESGVDYNSFDIAAQISANYEGECNAITGYYKLIPFFQMKGDTEAVAQIEEIISDEKNHQEILKELQEKYDGDIPTKED